MYDLHDIALPLCIFTLLTVELLRCSSSKNSTLRCVEVTPAPHRHELDIPTYYLVHY
jgi:hypothetical protein